MADHAPTNARLEAMLEQILDELRTIRESIDERNES